MERKKLVATMDMVVGDSMGVKIATSLAWLMKDLFDSEDGPLNKEKGEVFTAYEGEIDDNDNPVLEVKWEWVKSDYDIEGE